MITRLERLFDKLQEEKRITFEEFTDFCPRDGVAEAEILEEEDKIYYIVVPTTARGHHQPAQPWPHHTQCMTMILLG